MRVTSHMPLVLPNLPYSLVLPGVYANLEFAALPRLRMLSLASNAVENGRLLMCHVNMAMRTWKSCLKVLGFSKLISLKSFAGATAMVGLSVLLLQTNKAWLKQRLMMGRWSQSLRSGLLPLTNCANVAQHCRRNVSPPSNVTNPIVAVCLMRQKLQWVLKAKVWPNIRRETVEPNALGAPKVPLARGPVWGHQMAL